MSANHLLPHSNIEWTIEHHEARLVRSSADPQIRLQLAQLSLSHGLFHGGGEHALSKALAQAKKVLHDDRNSVEAMAIAAIALVRMERIDKAQPFLVMAQQRKSEHPLLSFACSAFDRSNGDLEGMLQHLERSIQLAPEAWESHATLGRMLFALSEAHSNAQMRERAQFHLLKAISLFPEITKVMSSVLLDLGILCLREEQFQEAEKCLSKLKEHPKLGLKSKRYLAEVAFQVGKYHNAIQRFRTYLNQKEALNRTISAQNRDRSSNAAIQAKIAMSWFKLGDLRRAKSECQRALQFDPNHLLARHTLGCILIEEGSYPEGLREFRENLHVHPEYIKSYRELVKLYKNAGDWDWLNKALLSEVSNYDRLPIGGVVDARVCTRERIQVIIEELKGLDADSASLILPVIAMTQDELLRFQLWEAACDIAEEVNAYSVKSALEQPDRNYSVSLGEDALSSAKHVPLSALMQGLNIQYTDIKAAALERYPQAHSLEAHQRNEKSEVRVARSYQMHLLLACAFHNSDQVSELFKRWTSGQNDRNMEIATWVGWALRNHRDAIGRLRTITKDRQASPKQVQALALATNQQMSNRVTLRVEDRAGKCRVCGKSHESVNHFIQGHNIQICDSCIVEAFTGVDIKPAHQSHSCSLCGNTQLEAAPLLMAGSNVVCNSCAQLSLGYNNRVFVARALTSVLPFK